MARVKKIFNTAVTKYDLSKAQLTAIKEYVDNGGIISKAMTEAGRTRGTWYHWLKEEPFLLAKEAADEELKRRRRIDDDEKVREVEGKLYENALEGKSNEIFFYLKNRAPDRWANDYVQGQRYLQSNTQNNFYIGEFADMSNKELMEQVKQLSGAIGKTEGREAKSRKGEEVTDVEFRTKGKDE